MSLQNRFSRIGITGSRDHHNLQPLREFIRNLPPNTTIVLGDCRGVDEAAFSEAKDRGLRVIVKPANWAKYGKAAGPIRNQQIIQAGITALYAFPDLENSDCDGTRDCVKQAKRAGIPVFIM